MRTLNTRIQGKAATTTAAVQSKTHIATAPNGAAEQAASEGGHDGTAYRARELELMAGLSPRELAEDFENRLATLRDGLNESVALALMNAEVIAEAVDGMTGWERFEVPGFGAGVLGLASTAGHSLKVYLEDFTNGHAALLARAKLSGEVVGRGRMEFPEEAPLLERMGCAVDGEAWQNMGRGVGALQHLLELQSCLLVNRHHEAAGPAVQQAQADLALYWGTVERASLRLREAVAITEFNRTQRAAA